MRGRIRTILCCGLAILNVALSVGNPTGFVLCVGHDGSMAIESPAAQAACVACCQRHDGVGAPSPGGFVSLVGARGSCVDIPLSLAPGAVLHRSHQAGRMAAGRLEMARLGVQGLPIGIAPLTARRTPSFEARPPSSLALSALRTVVLLI
jgi:hypothetical protein